MDFCVRVPGSCGELLQGWQYGEPFLVTCPIARYTTVSVSSAFQERRGLGFKAERALQLTLSALGRRHFPYGLQLQSELPQSKGMASSSADIAAVAAAVSFALQRPLTVRQILSLAVQIEPTDAVFLRDIVRLNQVTGRILAVYRDLPYLRLSIFDTGGTVDTEACYHTAALQKRNRDWRPYLLKMRQGEREMAAAAAQSAVWQDEVLPKPCLRSFLKKARSLGALGLTAAHSGTVLGVLWPSYMEKSAIAAAAAALQRSFPELMHLGLTAMRPGGIEIFIEANEEKKEEDEDGRRSFRAWRQYL